MFRVLYLFFVQKILSCSWLCCVVASTRTYSTRIIDPIDQILVEVVEKVADAHEVF